VSWHKTSVWALIVTLSVDFLFWGGYYSHSYNEGEKDENYHVLEVYSTYIGLFDSDSYIYMATDGDGMIHAFESEPEWSKGEWMNTPDNEAPIIFLANYSGDLMYDYRDSLRTVDSIYDYSWGDSQ